MQMATGEFSLHHDALGHHSKIVSESNSGESVEITTHEEAICYLGLVQARRNSAQAKKTYLVSHGPDRSGGRPLVEITVDLSYIVLDVITFFLTF